MKKIVLFLLLCFFSLSSFVYAEYGPKKDRYTIFLNISRTETSYTNMGSTSITAPKIENEFGGGLTYNAFRVEYNKYFEGYRISGAYDFFRDSLANPYIGFTYIGGVGDLYNRDSKQRIQGYDGTLGLSLNFFGIVKPYVEYNVFKSIFFYGIRFHLGKSFYRKDPKNRTW